MSSWRTERADSKRALACGRCSMRRGDKRPYWDDHLGDREAVEQWAGAVGPVVIGDI
jgi:hypothetical protein